MNEANSSTSHAVAPAFASWLPITEPPEPYEMAYLLFSDGKVRHGTWNGRIWWGYDERIRRSRALDPVAWARVPPTATRPAGPHPPDDPAAPAG